MSAQSAQPPVPRRRSAQAKQSAVALALDYPLIAIVLTFLLLGLVMVLSASFPRAGTYYFWRQLRWVLVGTVVFVGMAALPYRYWTRLAVPLMGVTLLALAAVLVLNRETFGAVRTLSGGSFQPSELAKLAVVIYVAAWAASPGRQISRFEDGLLPFLLIMALVGGLIAAERSFSVTIVTLSIGLVIYFVSGGNIKQILLLVVAAIPVLAFLMHQAGYPFKRIQDWYNVWFHPSQAPEDLLRIFWMLREGRGIGHDPAFWQVKAAVPGLWSDYLFANIGADLHILGTLLVLGCYVWFGYRALGIALNAPDRFGALLAIGVTAWILIQASVHIGASLALIPVTGQTLPFMSYGGSSLVSCMAAAGLLISISRARTEKKAVYAHFAFGWRDRRPRLSRPRSGHRVEGADRARSGGRVTRAGGRQSTGGRTPARRNAAQRTRSRR